MNKKAPGLLWLFLRLHLAKYIVLIWL